MPTPEEFFAPWEGAASPIADWATMLAELNRVIDYVGPARKVAWRGLSDASYAPLSTLSRRIIDKRGSADENAVVRFETSLLEVARKRWRFDDLGALELMAQLQHFGAPTRLLDVTFNPLIALWFAVEPKFKKDGTPRPDIAGRLIAYDVTSRQVSLDAYWGARSLPWSNPLKGWRNDLPYVWRPPSYNPRIPAQDSAFLVGGVPSSGNRWWRKAPGDSTYNALWPIADVRRVSSVNMRMYSLSRPYGKSQPTLTIRIPKEAKADIRRVLDHNFGINTASVYPDFYGLAQRGAFEVDF